MAADWNAIGALFTAVAAITAIVIWLVDIVRRRHERRATERFLAQVMLTLMGAAQLQIVKLRSNVAPPDNDHPIRALLESQSAREEIVARTARVSLELPSSVLDKADVFRPVVSNRMAWALSSISRLNEAAKLVGEADETSTEGDLEAMVLHFLKQMKETEEAIDGAFQALLEASKA